MNLLKRFLLWSYAVGEVISSSINKTQKEQGSIESLLFICLYDQRLDVRSAAGLGKFLCRCHSIHSNLKKICSKIFHWMTNANGMRTVYSVFL